MTPTSNTLAQPEWLAKAFPEYENQQRVANAKVACVLAIFLMPMGSAVDYFVYPDELRAFFELRLLCSAILGMVWIFLSTKWGSRHNLGLGVMVPLLPAISMGVMIAMKEGFASPYYAGLNLVLLGVGAVMHWTSRESIIAALLVLGIYIAAGVTRGSIPGTGVLVGNFFFIGLMDLILVVGTYFQSRQRFREFALRFELDENRQKLEESNRKLMELDDAKSRFFANISHELRTPLTLLIAPLENLLNRFRQAFDEETRNLLLTMQSNGMRLLKLINDLLDLVRLESGQLHVKREPMEVADFIKGLASAVRQVAADKRINLDTKIDPELSWVLADRDKLEKIILNLVFNALKFTPAGGRVSLWAEKQGADWVLTVQDTGMGISAQNLKNVFSRFWQADDSSRRKYQGVGIGLALVKELTEVQGGKASVTSEEGKGTTFRVQLPFEKAEAGEGAVEQQAPAGPASAVTQPAMGTAAGSNEWLSS